MAVATQLSGGGGGGSLAWLLDDPGLLVTGAAGALLSCIITATIIMNLRPHHEPCG